MSGRKDDAGKYRISLVPWAPLLSVVRVLEHGARRYGDSNWLKVENHRERYFNALHRHLGAWWMGEKSDPDTGESHLAHVVACALFLLARDGEEKSDV